MVVSPRTVLCLLGRFFQKSCFMSVLVSVDRGATSVSLEWAGVEGGGGNCTQGRKAKWKRFITPAGENIFSLSTWLL